MFSSNATAPTMLSTDTRPPPPRVFQPSPLHVVRHATGRATTICTGPVSRSGPVTAANMEECHTIASLLMTYPFITIDDEYAGVVHRPPSTTWLALGERGFRRLPSTTTPPVQLGPGLQIRPVTAANVGLELDAIASLLMTYTYIIVDVEYAGVVHRPPPSRTRLALAPHERYALVKCNVDEVPVVQLGITLSDEHGNLPVVVDGHGRPFELAWEVTFSDFDARHDRHAPDSVAFLRSQGVDFDHARNNGVSSAAFAAKLAAVLSATPNRDELTWAAFGGAHDFAYVVKMLSGGRPLPENWHGLMAQAKALLGGGRVFDAKYMAEHCERADLCGGGLRRVAACLGVRRNFPGLPYLAAQKSHTACLVYTVLRRHVLDRDGGAMLQGLIDGLQW